MKQEEVNIAKIATQLVIINNYKSILKGSGKNETDLKMEKLKGVNTKLMS